MLKLRLKGLSKLLQDDRMLSKCFGQCIKMTQLRQPWLMFDNIDAPNIAGFQQGRKSTM